MERKQFLKNLGMSGMMLPLLLSCKKDEDAAPQNTSGDCQVTEAETAGPFPTKNPSGFVMKDIRSDRTGILFTIMITVLDKSHGCDPLVGALVDIWHCDKDGYYSEYGGVQLQSIDFTASHFLRGRQTTDSNGQVGFISIFPGWYSGRAAHIHVHVYGADGKSLLVTQIAFPEGANSAVSQVNASTANGYKKGMSGYTSNSSDNVFSDGVSDELGMVTGTIADGFVLTHQIIVAA